MKDERALGLPRPALLSVSLLALLVLLLIPSALPGSESTSARFVMPKTVAKERAGTPVVPPEMEAARPDDPLAVDKIEPAPDPLDGDLRDRDPLDGPLADEDAPADQTRIAISRSGRPSNQPPSLTAYDDDPETIWTPSPSEDEPWLWFDLGAERRLRDVRWLARGSGAVTVAISKDRRRWQSFDNVAVRRGWNSIPLADDARFVRLLLSPGETGDLPSLAEVTVYGSERARGGEAAPTNERDGVRSPRKRRGQSEPPVDVVETAQKAEKADNGGKRKGRIEVSAKEGETHCRGKKARCRAQKGRVSVEEDCAGNGTCVIEVQANGGSATCDASGGDVPREVGNESRRGRAGERDNQRSKGSGSDKERGTNRVSDQVRGTKGGRCEAVANGGTVTIGDINP